MKGDIFLKTLKFRQELRKHFDTWEGNLVPDLISQIEMSLNCIIIEESGLIFKEDERIFLGIKLNNDILFVDQLFFDYSPMIVVREKQTKTLRRIKYTTIKQVFLPTDELQRVDVN